MAVNRQVGSLWCFDVLAKVGDYVDGELSEAERVEVERHLAGCAECTRFGGEFGAIVKAVRQKLGVGDVPEDVAGRLEDALKGQ